MLVLEGGKFGIKMPSETHMTRDRHWAMFDIP